MKLFITIGGGTFSLIEAVNYASPLMVISLEDKRRKMIDRLISKGYGKHFNFDELDEKIFKDSVSEMLEKFDDSKKSLEDLSILSKKVVSLENPLEKIIRAVNITIETRKIDLSRRFDFSHVRCACCDLLILVIAASALLLITNCLLASIMNKLKKFTCRRKTSDNSKHMKAKKSKKIN